MDVLLQALVPGTAKLFGGNPDFPATGDGEGSPLVPAPALEFDAPSIKGICIDKPAELSLFGERSLGSTLAACGEVDISDGMGVRGST
jgi:hypothetical protein